jgi:hypothetical protein
MLIDCDRCAMRGISCGDCVVTAMMECGPGIGEGERRALGVLADAGLVSPLRLVLPETRAS